MSCLELVIIILVVGFVSMIEICTVTACISKTIDAKMRQKAMIEHKLFKTEMKAITDLLDVYLEKFFNLVEGKGKDAHILEKPKTAEKVEDLDFDEDPEDWLKN